MKRQEKQSAEVEVVKTTIRLPRELSDQLKHRAIDEGCTSQELVERALRNYLKQKGGRP